MAKYIPSWEGHHTTELYSKYPLQMITPHPRYSFHTMYDGKESWMNEVPEHRVKAKDGYYYWIMRMNPQDAAKRSIKEGDIVKAFNDRGDGPAGSPADQPGAAGGQPIPGSPVRSMIPSASRAQSPDRGGCINTLTPHRFVSKNACGMAPGSCLIEIEKWEAK